MRVLFFKWSIFFIYFFSTQPLLAQKKYSDAANRTEKWLASLQLQDENGYYWPVIKDSVASTIDLYSGNSGIVLFYAELYKVSGKNKYLDVAEKGLQHLLSKLPIKWDEENAGLYTGGAGLFYTLHQLYLITNNTKYLAKSQELFQALSAYYFSDSAKSKLANDIVYGYAGAGLTYLYADKNGVDKKSLKHAKEIGDILLQNKVDGINGIRWPMLRNDTARKFFMPNFSHGTAGIAYFLCCLYEKTKEQKYLDAALKGAAHLKAIADSNGWLYHAEPNQQAKERFYLSWCHGPAGTARLFYKLYAVTGDKSWEMYMLNAAKALMKCGIPEKQTKGFWNNVSVCCGSAGVADFFLSLYELYGKKEYKEFAFHMTDDLLRRATVTGETQYWVQAEHRSLPDLLQAQTGLMQGAAGLGITLLHASYINNKNKQPAKLPDNPF
jgi:lantibiotic modifying enzyme